MPNMPNPIKLGPIPLFLLSFAALFFASSPFTPNWPTLDCAVGSALCSAVICILVFRDKITSSN